MVAGKGKATRGKDSEGKKVSVSVRCGLTIPVARVRKLMMKHRVAERISPTAPVFLAATIEYVCGELLEISCLRAKEVKKSTLMNRHIYMGAKSDKELYQLILGGGACIKDAGFVTDNPIAKAKKEKKGDASSAAM